MLELDWNPDVVNFYLAMGCLSLVVGTLALWAIAVYCTVQRHKLEGVRHVQKKKDKSWYSYRFSTPSFLPQLEGVSGTRNRRYRKQPDVLTSAELVTLAHKSAKTNEI